MLTDVGCKALIKEANAVGKAIKKADGKGLIFYAQPNGSAYWRYRYTVHGKEKVLALGVYPETTLQEAREKHAAAHKLVANGQDPSELRQQQKRQNRADHELVFQLMAEEWYKLRLPRWKAGYAATVKRRLEKDLYPQIGHLPLKKITPSVMLEALQKIEQREAYEMARRALSSASEIFMYCVAKEYISRNQDPTPGLIKLLIPYKKTHHPALEAKDLPDFIHKLDRNEMQLTVETRHLVEMMLLTFVRTKELIKAEKKHFDLDEAVWMIPGEMMKMDNDHIVPLARQTLALVKRQIALHPGSPYLFPSKHIRAAHMSNGTILSALDAMGYRGTHTGHGFRALGMSTIKEKLKYPHDVVDRQLGHKPKGAVNQAYDRAQYLDDRTKMMQDWADYIDHCRIKALQKALQAS